MSLEQCLYYASQKLKRGGGPSHQQSANRSHLAAFELGKCNAALGAAAWTESAAWIYDAAPFVPHRAAHASPVNHQVVFPAIGRTPGIPGIMRYEQPHTVDDLRRAFRSRRAHSRRCSHCFPARR